MSQKTSQPLETRLLRAEDGAAYLGITVRSLYRLVDRGIIAPVRVPGIRRTLFDKRDLEAVVESAKTGAEEKKCQIAKMYC